VDRPRRQDPFAPLFEALADRVGDESWRPAVDVYETEKGLVVVVELAGVRREDVRVTVDGDLLRIRGTRVSARDESTLRLHQVEIAVGPFERVLRIGADFDRDAVHASLEEGCLRIVLPKRLPEPRRRIGVEG
jgi:HSP20 family protein